MSLIPSLAEFETGPKLTIFLPAFIGIHRVCRHLVPDYVGHPFDFPKWACMFAHWP